MNLFDLKTLISKALNNAQKQSLIILIYKIQRSLSAIQLVYAVILDGKNYCSICKRQTAALFDILMSKLNYEGKIET